MRLLLVFILGFNFFGMLVYAKTKVNHSKNALVCITKDYFLEAMQAVQTKDEDAMLYLINNTYCLFLKKGIHCTVLKRNANGLLKIRIYAKGKGIEAYTYEALIK